MPLFLKNKICLIHIPKCGGTTFEKAFENQLNDPPLYFSANFAAIQSHPMEHSPQHATFKELKNMNMIPKDFTIISFIRNPYDRFISEYSWRLKERLISKEMSQDNFAKIFFSKEKKYFWDNHDKPQFKFLEGGMGFINVLNINEMDNYFEQKFGIKIEKKNTTQSEKMKISELTKNIVKENWGTDFNLFK